MLKDDLLKDGLITQEDYDNWEPPEINREAIRELVKFVEENCV